MGDADKQLSNLSQAQRTELYRLLKARNNKKQLPHIAIQSRDSVSFPLSFSQEALWFLTQLYPANTSYNVYEALHITGYINVHALEKALNTMIMRHESLRTIFSLENNEPVQIVTNQDKLFLPIIDVNNLSSAEKEQEIQKLLSERITLPFDLSKGPLFNVVLMRKSEKEHIFLIITHHIVIDFWSVELLMEELFLCYAAFAEEKLPSLPPLPVQYVDYACWQRNWLSDQIVSTELAYWRERLAGAPLFLDLPTDHPRRMEQTFNGKRQKFSLPESITKQLMILCRQEGVTLFMAMLAVFQLLLSHYSEQDDVVVGTSIAHRPFEETARIVGFFLNTLIIRTDLSQVSSFRDLLANVRKTTLEAHKHQNIPFMYIVQELQKERDLSYQPLFQVMFALNHKSSFTLPGLTIKALEIENKTSKVDLICYIEEEEEKLWGYLEYNTDLFEEETILCMSRHFQTLLENVVNDPDQPLRNVSLLTPLERLELVAQAKSRSISSSSTVCLHALFESQARQRPDAIALVDGDLQFTYQNLDRRSNQLAHYLLNVGVEADVSVGLCVERSWELVVGVLGILKAGGAYVPVDPSYPLQRIAFIFSDACVSIVVTKEPVKEKLSFATQTVVCLDRDWPDIAREGSDSPMRPLDSAAAAYLIYTSGSTGTPKGVVVSHANVTRLFTITHPMYRFNQHDIWTLFHSISFDFAVWELWGALLYGGRLIIVPYWTSRTPEAFYRLLAENQVTILNQTPSAFSQLMRADEEAAIVSQFLSLRLIIFGGEALHFADLEPWFARHGDQNPQLVNMYGITETTVHATAYPLTAQEASAGVKSIIGRPLPDLRVYILDRALHLVPPGVPGELYVGGAGLARNYQGRPDLTAERFIPDPFSSVQGRRLYKTGDRARYLRNGDIEYLGRIDEQVKIRGFRIELGEIEGILKRHPRVQSAAVAQREDRHGDRKLVAYLVPDLVDERFLQEVRMFLQDQLPEYMIPSAFVILEALPLTTNGKIDRKMLPAVDETHSARKAVAPQTPVEDIVAGVWMQVLHLPLVSRQDNFFELGGHSLLATQVTSRLRSIFQIEIPVKQLFATPTIEGLARFISLALQAPSEQQGPEMPFTEIVAVSDRENVPLTFSQQRLWFLSQLEPGSPVYNIIMAFRLKGTLDLMALQRTFRELLCRHEILRTSFRLLNEHLQQVIAPESSVVQAPVKLVDLSLLCKEAQEAEGVRHIHEEWSYPFDLTQGPLLRITLLHLEDEHILIISMHHIIFDGWSQNIFFQEISLLYQAFLDGQGSPLAPLPIQYADYAIWQRSSAHRRILDRQLVHWKDQLENVPAAFALPTDHPRPPVRTFKGASLLFQLPDELTEKLKIFCKQEGVTLFMLLLAVFNVLLYRYTNQEDIVVGSPVANRNRPEIEGLLGFFVNTLVLRTDLSNSPSFRELLQRVRQMTLAAYAHQDVPFDLLVEELHAQRFPNLNPFFQILFDFQNAPSSGVELKNLITQPLTVDIEVAKFDLSLSIEYTGHHLQGTCIYSTDLFERETVARMVQHFQYLLKAAVMEPGRSISRLSFLTEEEHHYLFNRWNSTKIAWPQDICLHMLFEEQAEKTPDRIAVVFEDQYLTYFELKQITDQLALHLQTLGVKPEVVVGICMQRSLDLVIGMLGVLKAKGAYVPIDPSAPKERRDFMLADSNVHVLLTHQSLMESSFSDCHIPVVCLDVDKEIFDREKGVLPIAHTTSDNLAYIIYTSGSTGWPKGVMISHRAICNHMFWMRSVWPLSMADSVLQRTPASFDASVWEFYAPLITGARLVLAEPGDRGSSEHILKTIVQQNITVLQLTPSILQILVEEPAFKQCQSLTSVYCGGEALSTDLLHQLRNILDVDVYNLYGPTEATIEASFWQYTPENERSTALIGSPIANTQMYILDTHLQAVPIGVAGELYISGTGLARGYLHQPERTAERFIPHPFSVQPGERLYRTGDIARYLSNGAIEYLGRVDRQLKFRGYRIELEEIEVVLKSHPSIQEAVVTMRPNDSGDRRLVAYIAVCPGVAFVHDDVRSYLQTRLPDYMVPTLFVVLEAFPLTSNGKINHHALPEPDWRRLTPEKTPTAPRTSIEQMLADNWMQLLGITTISIDDNFFDLGGHSLLATRLIARLRAIFPIEIPLRSIFDAPTIRQLASFIEEKLLDKLEGLSEEEIQTLMSF